MISAAGERRFQVLADAQAVATEAANHLIARTEAQIRPAICLTGGSGPKALYALLGSPSWRSRIPWDRVHWFIGDERFVSAGDPLNNMAMAKSIFLDACAPPENIHPVPTDAPDPDQAARLYEHELQTFYGAHRLDASKPLFDLVLMGLGPDGHTASLFPGDKALDEAERWVVGVDHAHVEPFVPRVTLTLPALDSSREMLFLVTGDAKRDILSKITSGADLPGARAHSNGVTTWLTDAAAAGRTA
ncbi:6-phosphogluconolactonase [Nitrobacter sp.]|uniref:6-phosphogluconolactonase n=1 Tax=Nitrobacter sp. TaxID=29420 RepID=UPI0029CAB8E2|nr:6-phosphogluconolactonase [Nitrobacter sp.]